MLAVVGPDSPGSPWLPEVKKTIGFHTLLAIVSQEATWTRDRGSTREYRQGSRSRKGGPVEVPSAYIVLRRAACPY